MLDLHPPLAVGPLEVHAGSRCDSSQGFRPSGLWSVARPARGPPLRVFTGACSGGRLGQLSVSLGLPPGPRIRPPPHDECGLLLVPWSHPGGRNLVRKRAFAPPMIRGTLCWRSTLEYRSTPDRVSTRAIHASTTLQTRRRPPTCIQLLDAGKLHGGMNLVGLPQRLQSSTKQSDPPAVSRLRHQPSLRSRRKASDH